MSLAQLSKAVLQSPAQVAASLPALIGFTPAESVVVIMTKSGAIEVTMRIDLSDDWAAASRHIADTAARIGVDGAVIAVCTDSASGWSSNRAGVLLTIDLLTDAGVVVADALLIQENRYWSYLRDLDGAQGAVFFPEDSPLPLLVEESREVIVSRYALRPEQVPSNAAYEAAQRYLDGSLRQRCHRAREALEQLTHDQRVGVSVGADLLRATIQLAIQDVKVRDWLLASVVADKERAALAQALADTALSVTGDLASRACGAAAAALAATNASTIPAACLVELAGEDSLAEIVHRAISSGINPKDIQAMFATALPELEAAITQEEASNGAGNEDESGDPTEGCARRVS